MVFISHGLLLNAMPFHQTVTGGIVTQVFYLLVTGIILVMYFCIGGSKLVQCCKKKDLFSEGEFQDQEPSEGSNLCQRTILGIVVLNLVGCIIAMGLFYSFMYREVTDANKKIKHLRLGSISSNSANLILRDPCPSEDPSGDFTLQYRESGTELWLKSNPQDITAKSDYVGTFLLTNLTAKTSYQVDYNNGALTASFTTFPMDDTSASFRLMFGSCWMSNFPWKTKSTTWELSQSLNPDIFIFLGDFIYADHPWTKGKKREDFRRHYRMATSNEDYIQFAKNIPWFSGFDDHEITDNWNKGISGIYKNAMQVWDEYFGNGNPNSYVDITTYYNFKYGDNAFFVLDSRSYRDNDAVPPSILGVTQKNYLKDWLNNSKTTATWKFICSPTPFTANINCEDCWQGYLEERAEILNFIRINRIRNVIFLSGDRHYTYTVNITQGDWESVYEFSSSPVSAFPSRSEIDFYRETDKVLFKDNRHQSFFAGHTMYHATMDVDTTVSPSTLKFKSYVDGDVSSPIYELLLKSR